MRIVGDVDKMMRTEQTLSKVRAARKAFLFLGGAGQDLQDAQDFQDMSWIGCLVSSVLERRCDAVRSLDMTRGTPQES